MQRGFFRQKKGLVFSYSRIKLLMKHVIYGKNERVLQFIE